MFVCARPASLEGYTDRYLEGLAEAIDHDELSAFSDERRVALFKRISSNGKKVTAEDFESLADLMHTLLKGLLRGQRLSHEGKSTQGV